MSDFKNNYKLAFDDINVLTEASYYSTTELNPTSTADKEKQVVEDMLSLLINAYKLGTESVCETLNYDDYKLDIEDMGDAIFLLIEDKTFEDRVIDHVDNGDVGGLKTLANTEFHRVYNAGAYDTATAYDKTHGNVKKYWLTVGDEKVRETHDYLEGEGVGLNEEFYTYDGDHALYPGGFQQVENNANCRCILAYRHDDI